MKQTPDVGGPLASTCPTHICTQCTRRARVKQGMSLENVVTKEEGKLEGCTVFPQPFYLQSDIFFPFAQIIEEQSLESRKQTPPPKTLLFLRFWPYRLRPENIPTAITWVTIWLHPADHAQEMVLPMGGSTQVFIKNADTPGPDLLNQNLHFS